MLSPRENELRTIEFGFPEWIPVDFDLMRSVIHAHGTRLVEMMTRHPLLFPPARIAAVTAAVARATPFRERRFTDAWGCEWLEIQDGILGQVVGHPLADWSGLAQLRVPDPAAQWDWDAIRRRCREQRERGELVNGYMSVVEGSFFDRLQFLRGLDNLLVDFMERPPELDRLIEQVLDYNRRLVRLWLEAGVDVLHFHGDIAMQNSLMMSPATFRAVLKPGYRELFQTCRRAGVHVKYSCDGCLLEIVDDLIECGVSYHDPQVRACGIDGIAKAYRGRLCAMVDIDEQMLPFATPAEVEEQVREVIATIGLPRGGLMLYICPSADVPLANIEAVCTAWERYGAPGRWATAQSSVSSQQVISHQSSSNQ